MKKRFLALQAALKALDDFEKGDCLLKDSLNQFSPTLCLRDRKLAQQLAFSCCRLKKRLDWYIVQLSSSKCLPQNAKEKNILRLALYQLLFMKGAPAYAVVNSWVELAKESINFGFGRYLNALMRRVQREGLPELPKGLNAKELAICHSYPEGLIKHLQKYYDDASVDQILTAGNQPSSTVARLRPGKAEAFDQTFWQPITNTPCPIAKLLDPASAGVWVAGGTIAIQGAAQTMLIYSLAEQMTTRPQTILDMCAAPGGKLLLLHDLYPQAKLYGNDISAARLAVLQENLKTYHLQAHLSCSDATELQKTTSFDLILIDAPCSNSGVLAKRPEARWRLDNKIYLEQLIDTQKKLLEKASSLLPPEGQLWYTTCSLLPQENEEMAQFAEQTLDLSLKAAKLLLPSAENNYEGGFCCSFIKKL